MMGATRIRWTLSLMLASILSASVCHAGQIFTVSGTGTGGTSISYQAEFDFIDRDSSLATGVGGDGLETIQLTLTNLSDNTDVRGNLITGFWFSLNSVSALDVNSFDGTAGTVVTSVDGNRIPDATSSNVDIAPAVNNTATDGTFQFEAGPFGTSNNGDDYSAFDYGLTTTAGGLGSFSGAALNGGNGQDDYGIFTTNDPNGALANNLVAGSTVLPLIDTTATFFWDRPNDFLLLSQIDEVVRFSRGSLPDGFLDTSTQVIPEPSTLALAFFGILCFGLLRRRTNMLSVTG